MSGSKPKDISGERFGLLTAVREAGRKDRRVLWLCVCECGGEKIIDGIRLRNGAVKSCGCWKTVSPPQLRHGHNRKGKRSSTYNSWHHMRQRCFNTRSPKWSDYGGRGITVCERWQGSFEAFLEDMGECPHGHTLDRIDVNGNYEPTNCRWANAQTQSRNVRRNVHLTSHGETLPIWEWAERTGISVGTINMRKLRGWSDEEALSAAMGKRR